MNGTASQGWKVLYLIFRVSGLLYTSLYVSIMCEVRHEQWYCPFLFWWILCDPRVSHIQQLPLFRAAGNVYISSERPFFLLPRSIRFIPLPPPRRKTSDKSPRTELPADRDIHRLNDYQISNKSWDVTTSVKTLIIPTPLSFSFN